MKSCTKRHESKENIGGNSLKRGHFYSGADIAELFETEKKGLLSFFFLFQLHKVPTFSYFHTLQWCLQTFNGHPVCPSDKIVTFYIWSCSWFNLWSTSFTLYHTCTFSNLIFEQKQKHSKFILPILSYHCLSTFSFIAINILETQVLLICFWKKVFSETPHKIHVT